ncbi:MAG TPA: hypothetical protein VNQ99_13075 [Xanthobacteraceae bacterium]|nr:hypothetical protein [Xanthobacteraceae bacterium]
MEPQPGASVVALENSFEGERVMGKGLLLWLIGIPLPIILALWLFGALS